MLRLKHSVLLLLMVVLVASLENPLEPSHGAIKPVLNNVNDLDADASAYGYSRPWRYGWKGGWGGWRSGWGEGGKGWLRRGGWWW